MFWLPLSLMFVACGMAHQDKSVAEEKPAVNTMNYAPTESAGADEGEKMKEEVNSATPSRVNSIPEPVSVKKHLIQTADIRFQVKNAEQSMEKLEGLVKKYGASITNSNLESDNWQITGKACIRVSPEYFSALIKDISAESIFMNYKNIKSDDVTAEYIDIETRLRTKREVEQRYIDILRNKAKTVEEVLMAENEIRAIHEEIEAKVGRLNYLKDQVAFNTINLEMYQQVNPGKMPEIDGPSYFGQIGDAFMVGWDVLKKIFLGLIYIWPLYILFFAIYFGVKRLVKGKK